MLAPSRGGQQVIMGLIWMLAGGRGSEEPCKQINRAVIIWVFMAGHCWEWTNCNTRDLYLGIHGPTSGTWQTKNNVSDMH